MSPEDTTAEVAETGADLTPNTDFTSVRDTIRAAIEEHDHADQTDSVKNADGAADQADETVELDSDDSDDKSEPRIETAENADVGDKDQPEEQDDKPEEVILAPASWNKDDRVVWETMGRAAQEVVARRESERDKVVNGAAREVAPIKQVVDKYKDYFDRRGVEPATAFEYLLAAEKSLQTGTPQSKRLALEQIARDYGIPMEVRAPARQEPAEADDLADPDLAKLRSDINERLSGIEGQLTSRQEAERTAEQTEAATTAARFYDALETMDPKEHPEVRYISQVEPRFQMLVGAERQAGRSPDLEGLKALFKDAAYSTPGVREAIAQDVAARAKAAEPKVVTKTVKKVSSSVSGGAGNGAHSKDPPKNESVRDTINRSIAELSQPGAIR